MSRAERAKAYFLEGYNCSQSLVLAFQDLTGLPESTLIKSALPFGGGLGRLRLTCGAVSGMAMVIGLIFSSEENSAENKKFVYALTQELCNKFKERNGSLLCGDLLTGANLQVEVGGEAEKRTQTYYKKRPCADLVYDCAQILEEYLEQQTK